jgi:putative transcriptional regulator
MASKTAKLSPKALARWEASRDIGAEILRGLKQMRTGKATRVHHIKVPEALEARLRTGLSQAKFAAVLGVSTRTLQGWEQGTRKPSGAARSLLAIAKRRPEVLAEVFAA